VVSSKSCTVCTVEGVDPELGMYLKGLTSKEEVTNSCLSPTCIKIDTYLRSLIVNLLSTAL